MNRDSAITTIIILLLGIAWGSFCIAVAMLIDLVFGEIGVYILAGVIILSLFSVLIYHSVESDRQRGRY